MILETDTKQYAAGYQAQATIDLALRLPDTAKMVELLRHASRRFDPDQIWINPDCDLKTRGCAEVRPAVENMVAAAKAMRTAR